LAQRPLSLIRHARLTRKQLILFALASAMLNGLITASVGAWLGQTYAKYQARKQSIEGLVHLVYERRTRAGMVASALRRNADVDEVRFRKRAYDEAFVDWNKNIMQNIFAIREVTGELMLSTLEGYFQDNLVAAMSDVDKCLTKAYDARISGADPVPVLEGCNMAPLHQFVLDCGATFTNELYKQTKLSFLPWGRFQGEGAEVSEARIKKGCTRPTLPAPIAAPATPAAAPPLPPPTAQTEAQSGNPAARQAPVSGTAAPEPKPNP
jgi:hypothetical protein